jgi:putative DNA methylase
VIPKDCKRLAEVDFPIAVVSGHAVREKSGPKGHISTLHLWWARRPLASSRAVLLALLWPDPCDLQCPEEFKHSARAQLPKVQGQVGPTDEHLRTALLKFIGDFANWDLAVNVNYLEISRALVKAAHGEDPILVADPFAGGGSIPAEALRLGCDAFASDLNPVACLILKVMLEDIPRQGVGFAEELRRMGSEIKKRAEAELGDLYPKESDGGTPIAYLWARTVRCESPRCGAEIPVFKSGWLSKKGAKKAGYLREAVDGPAVGIVVESKPLGGPITFRIVRGQGIEDRDPGLIPIEGTKAKGNNANVICPCCGSVLPGNKKNPRTVNQLAAQHGGADVVFDKNGKRTGGARLLAVVTIRPGERGRHYRLAEERDYEAARKAQERLSVILREWKRDGRPGLCPVPDEPLPPIGTLGFRVQRYGMLQWGDLFTARQKIALRSWIPLLMQKDVSSSPMVGGLALALSRMAMCGMSLTNWNAYAEKMQHTFGRQAVPMVWDFAEVVPLVHAPGAWQNACDLVAEVAEVWPGSSSGQSQLADAAEHPLPDQTATVWFTDPPYYDAVPYADLSDFFFVWLKRALPASALLRDPFDAGNPLTPKVRETVQDETKQSDGRPKDRIWFEEAMAQAFAEGRRVLREDGVGSVVFAHKTTEGWEALLSGMIRGGWTITGSWPIATEMSSRLRARESAALATSVHLICRPRLADAQVGDWANVLRELPTRVGDWMERLQGEGVRGADLVFACIGPALEIFSRYDRVETAEGRDVALAEYLEKVWEIVGRSALAQVLGTAAAKARNGAASAVEEDARLTALFLWTLQASDSEASEETGDGVETEEAADDDEDDEGASGGKAKGFTLVFDVVRRFAQPLGIELPKWEGRVIETKKGSVRLLPIGERAKQLFGEDGAQAVATRLEQDGALGKNPLQGMLFPEMENAPKARGRTGRGRGKRVAVDVSDESLTGAREATTLDRIHAAMLLQAGGRTNALRALLKAEQERGPEFLRLGNALSALYPKSSEEKRLIDAMLLAVPR